MIATFMCLQPGTPFVYQGQELGMLNVPADDWEISDFRDLETLNHWSALSKTCSEDSVMAKMTKAEYRKKSRDNARTPMQWDGSANAGFTSEHVQPWIRTNPSYRTHNIHVADQISDPNSVFTYWSCLLDLRKKYKDLFVYGMIDFDMHKHQQDEEVMQYTRKIESGEQALVICNWSAKKVSRRVDGFEKMAAILGNYGSSEVIIGDNFIELRPWETVVILGS